MDKFFFYTNQPKKLHSSQAGTQPSGYAGKNTYQISQNSKEELHNYFWLNKTKATNQTQNSKYNQMAPVSTFQQHAWTRRNPKHITKTNSKKKQKQQIKALPSSNSNNQNSRTPQNPKAPQHLHRTRITQQSTQNIVINTPI